MKTIKNEQVLGCWTFTHKIMVGLHRGPICKHPLHPSGNQFYIALIMGNYYRLIVDFLKTVNLNKKLKRVIFICLLISYKNYTLQFSI